MNKLIWCSILLILAAAMVNIEIQTSKNTYHACDHVHGHGGGGDHDHGDHDHDYG